MYRITPGRVIAKKAAGLLNAGFHAVAVSRRIVISDFGRKLTIGAMLWLMMISLAHTWATGNLQAQIEQAVRQLLTDTRYEYIVALNQTMTGAPERYDSLRVEPVGDALPFGNCWVRVFFYTDNAVVYTATLNAQVSWYQEMFVSTRAIPRGEPLTPDLFTVLRREVTSTADPAITSLDEIDGQEAARTIPQGKALTFSMVKPEEVIKRGDQVTIFYQSGNLQITASGEAREAGARGEVIKIKNLATNRIISAEVQDEQTVKVIR